MPFALLLRRRGGNPEGRCCEGCSAIPSEVFVASIGDREGLFYFCWADFHETARRFNGYRTADGTEHPVPAERG